MHAALTFAPHLQDSLMLLEELGNVHSLVVLRGSSRAVTHLKASRNECLGHMPRKFGQGIVENR